MKKVMSNSGQRVPSQQRCGTDRKGIQEPWRSLYKVTCELYRISNFKKRLPERSKRIVRGQNDRAVKKRTRQESKRRMRGRKASKHRTQESTGKSQIVNHSLHTDSTFPVPQMEFQEYISSESLLWSGGHPEEADGRILAWNAGNPGSNPL